MRIVSEPLSVVALLIIFNACSCKNSSSNSYSINEATTIEIPCLNDTVIRYSDFCTNVEVIPLEMTTYSTLAFIDAIFVSNNGDIIVFDGRSEKLLRFGLNGHFINQIGIKGRQSKEYNNITDFAYNPYENLVTIWDATKHKLLNYSLDGSFISSFDVSPEISTLGNFAILDMNHLVFRIYEVPSKNHSKNHIYDFWVTTKDGMSIVKKFHDSSVFLQSRSILHHQLKNTNRNSVYSHSWYSPDIFEITTDTIQPCFHLSFSDKCVSNEWAQYDEKTFYKMLEKPGVAYCSNFFATDRYYFVSASKGPLYLYVKERFGEGKEYSGFIAVNDMYGSYVLNPELWMGGSITPKYIHDGICYFVMDPARISKERIAELRIRLSSNVYDSHQKLVITEMVDKYDYIINNENPVILKCTLK